MNTEQARRAVLRREEDVCWIQLTQQFHRERGDVLRLLQRRQDEVRRAHEAEMRDAEQAFAVARAKQLREAEDDESKRRREQRELEERQRKAVEAQQTAKQQREEQKRERAAARIKKAEERRERQIARDSQREREQERKTAELHHFHRSEHNRTHARTPHPKTTSVEPVQGRNTAATPTLSPRRTIATQQEVEAELEAQKLEHRQILEVRRLQNLLAKQQREERERAEAEAERERLLQLKKEQMAKAEEERFLSQKQHVETIMALQREKDKRLTKRVLVPIRASKSATAGASPGNGEGERYRTVTPRTAAGSEAGKPNKQFDVEAIQRRNEAEAAAREELQRHQALLAAKNIANLEALRKAQEREKQARREQYQRELQEASRARQAEELAAQQAVEAVKEEQRRQEQSVALKRAERQKLAAVRAVETKLESVLLADQVAERDLQVFRDKMAEAEALTNNRKLARQLGNQKKLAEQQKHEAIILHNLKVRQEAQEELDRQRREQIKEQALAQQAHALDLSEFRERHKHQTHQVIASNEAFYVRESSQKKKKPRVPVQPEASHPVVLPPHPEMAALEREAATRMAAVEDDLAAVDSKMRALAHQRL